MSVFADLLGRPRRIPQLQFLDLPPVGFSAIGFIPEDAYLKGVAVVQVPGMRANGISPAIHVEQDLAGLVPHGGNVMPETVALDRGTGAGQEVTCG